MQAHVRSTEVKGRLFSLGGIVSKLIMEEKRVIKITWYPPVLTDCVKSAMLAMLTKKFLKRTVVLVGFLHQEHRLHYRLVILL